MKDYVIIFGAAVRPDGRPSAALRRRVDSAVRWARGDGDAMIIPTGGIGGEGPAEAEVMKELLLDAGIESRRIVVESTSRDTLESIRMCHAILEQRGDCRNVVCCTSAYHQPRCAMLLRLLGYRVIVPRVANSLGRLQRRTYAKLVLKEFVSLPYDAALLLMQGRKART